MANNRNIIITPNKGSTTLDPKIVLTGNDGTTDYPITVTALPTNNGTVSFEGSAGQLFSVSNTMTGTIFSANDVSGIPSIEVLDTGLVKLAQYSGNVVLGSASDTGEKLQVNGTIKATTFSGALSGNATTASTITSQGSLATLSSVGAAQITDNSVGAAELNVTGNGTTAQYLRSDGDGTFTWASPTVGTVTSVTAGNGMTQSGTNTINPTLNVVSHGGTAGSIGTINVGANAIGVNLGTTSTTAARGDHSHSYVAEGGTAFSGTYPAIFRIGANNYYSNANITYDGTANKLTVPNITSTLTGSSTSCTGNAATATWADTVDVNSGNTSSAWYDVVWHSGDTLYSSTGVEIQGSTGSIQTSGTVNAKSGVKLGTAQEATIKYNSTDNSIDFIIN